MKIGEGQLHEIYLDSGAWINCPPELIPAPGQYLLAHARGSDSPLAVPVFFSDSAPNGFRCAPLLESAWLPGTRLNLRGPIGRGFIIPPAARKVALIAFDDLPVRLHGLIAVALKQNAEVVLVCDSAVKDLSEVVEIQPLQALREIIQWADYAAMDVRRENLHQLMEMLGKQEHVRARSEAQILVRAPMPCGGLAECGVCALTLRHKWKMICKDGPVFEMKELF
ncbi:MAG: hypothetical protein Q7J80_11220 [Anaerolineales bacterium]|nr:hypothetical protein [Anaerolineales bacterium]